MSSLLSFCCYSLLFWSMVRTLRIHKHLRRISWKCFPCCVICVTRIKRKTVSNINWPVMFNVLWSFVLSLLLLKDPITDAFFVPGEEVCRKNVSSIATSSSPLSPCFVKKIVSHLMTRDHILTDLPLRNQVSSEAWSVECIPTHKDRNSIFLGVCTFFARVMQMKNRHNRGEGLKITLEKRDIPRKWKKAQSMMSPCKSWKAQNDWEGSKQILTDNWIRQEKNFILIETQLTSHTDRQRKKKREGEKEGMKHEGKDHLMHETRKGSLTKISPKIMTLVFQSPVSLWRNESGKYLWHPLEDRTKEKKKICFQSNYFST